MASVGVLCADQRAGLEGAVAPITAVDYGEIGAMVGQDLDLLQRRGKDVAVLRVAGETEHAYDEALIHGCGNADVAAKLVTHWRLVLRAAVDLGCAQRIYLIAALGRLMQQVRDEDEHV